MSRRSRNPIRYRGLVIQHSTGRDPRSGGDDHDTCPGRRVVECLLQRRGEGGGMHLFVLGDNNALGSYMELRRERSTVSVPCRRGDNDVDAG